MFLMENNVSRRSRSVLAVVKEKKSLGDKIYAW